VDPAMIIDGMRVLEKQGGKTGHWQAQETTENAAEGQERQ